MFFDDWGIEIEMKFLLKIYDMKRHLLILLSLFLLSPLLAEAQYRLAGTVINMESGDPIVGANVTLEGTNRGTVTDLEGQFDFGRLEAGTYVMEVSYVGYMGRAEEIDLVKDLVFDVGLVKVELLLDDVLISATRAKDNSPTTFTTVTKEELEKGNLAVDMPYLLELTPSVTVTSDAGAGVGYTGIRVRGSDATRVNITLNGIPLNDSESQGTFWVNLPDFASSVNDIQIQRGLGTSTNGAAAFGASVNIQTTTLEPAPYGELNNSYGSFDTRKHTVKFGTGMIKDRFTFDGRLSSIQSDGYVDRASADLKSYFFSGAFYGKNNILRANIFSGKEITYQSWNGVSEELLETDRTHNDYTYDNQVDNYRQDHYQLHYSHQLTSPLRFTGALFYTYGTGFYEQFKDGEDLADYGFENTSTYVIEEGDTSLQSSTDLIRRKWLDNDFFGATYGLNYQEGALDATLGGGISRYVGDHFGEVIWARFAGTNGNIRDRYYDNTGFKTDANIFLKADYTINERLGVFGDLQFRTINYDLEGVDEDQGPIDLNFQYNFFNPKFGVAYQLTPWQKLYASFGIGHREPTRANLVDNAVTPTAEQLRNLEVGYELKRARYAILANYYLMQYKDQLVLTGNLNDVGSPIQQNVPSSYRMGLELSGGVSLLDNLRWDANVTFSSNKIKEFTQTSGVFSDAWDYLGDTTFVYENTDISFSPSVVAASTLTYEPVRNLELSLLSKLVGKQYLDNTSNDARALDPFFVNHLRARYTLRTKWVEQIGLTFQVNNLLNALYESNGYTYFIPFADESGNVRLDNFNFYYPQAGVNVMGGLSLRF